MLSTQYSTSTKFYNMGLISILIDLDSVHYRILFLVCDLGIHKIIFVCKYYQRQLSFYFVLDIFSYNEIRSKTTCLHCWCIFDRSLTPTCYPKTEFDVLVVKTTYTNSLTNVCIIWYTVSCNMIHMFN